MSRIGKKPVVVPDKVTVAIDGNTITVKGPKGELKDTFLNEVNIEQKENEIILTRKDEKKFSRSVHGLSRALLQNMITGVTEGFEKKLDIVGVGFKVELKGENLLMTVGYSHPIYFMPPEGITLETPTQTSVIVKGFDKQLVGQCAAKIRSFRKPEPYKGKGIKYSDEYIRRKAGKTAG